MESPRSPLLFFTDGAYEDNDDGATIGGVVIAPGMPVEVFGALVPEQLVSQWKAEGKVHLIARSLRKSVIGGRRVLLFVDNWPVLDTFVKGTAIEKIWRQLLMVLEKEDEDFPTYIWAARVPSHSNPADHPRRGTLDPLKFVGKMHIRETSCPILNVPLKSTI